MAPPFKPVPVGMTFGRLKVLVGYGSDYLCHCECGKDTIVPRRYLLSGGTKSCGCLRRETTRLRGIRIRPKKLDPARVVYWRDVGKLTYAAIGRVIAKEMGRSKPFNPATIHMTYQRAKALESSASQSPPGTTPAPPAPPECPTSESKDPARS